VTARLPSRGGSAVARLFVAVWPPTDVVTALHTIPRPDERGVRWVAPATWHMTLRFLGDADPDAVASRLDATALPAAVARLGPTVSRFNRAFVVVPVAGLDELAAAVAAATADIGQPPDPRPFAGHLTLARLRQRAACGVAGTPFQAEFAVREVALVASEPGPRYTNVAVWPTG
jgi:2'-5' RNA ligase